VVLCDPTEELLDECWTCTVGAMCQVVHQLGRELQTSGVKRYQLPSQPFVREPAAEADERPAREGLVR
jgi:hypothetical protein